MNYYLIRETIEYNNKVTTEKICVSAGVFKTKESAWNYAKELIDSCGEFGKTVRTKTYEKMRLVCNYWDGTEFTYSLVPVRVME